MNKPDYMKRGEDKLRLATVMTYFRESLGHITLDYKLTKQLESPWMKTTLPGRMAWY